MPLNVVVGGGEYAASSVIVYPGGVAKTVRRVEAWNGSAWKVVRNFAPSFSLTISPSALYADSIYPTPATSDPATAFVSGGTGPFTYAWSQTGGPGVSILSPTLATTRFRASPPEGEFFECQFQCVATDSIGQIATAFLPVTFSR